ncbi:hypothetical protein DP125_13275 [Clostridium tetani]|uniref:Phage protein n=1 Tax=Clostridium tetani TaxID=1513 RepID=A0ABY0EPY1_CLOTA|nr:hypothetical protein [Clostridium tetani]KHO36728.1 hypothetical protein OR62_11065 [Clostridium tetani]RXI56950.1 hypothetical protein DP131_06530 [Clostridium tetani]RXI57660.1 hypothetical protein DP125_13275 [Clostridium tetani]RXI65322.1 hypothetical protein DQN76_14640 [Clostridium tetani]
MKIGKILKMQQPDIHKQLNKNRKQNKKKSRGGKQEHLSFSDVMELMKHNSYCRGKGGALKQR